MFVSISFVEKVSEQDSQLYRLVYLLEDSTYTVKLNVPIEKDIYDSRGNASIIPSGLISIYQEWQENVPKNLATFYVRMIGHLPIPEQNKLLHIDRKWTEDYFPDLEYTKKYFRCVVNQMKSLKYTGIPNAKPIIRAVL